MRLDAHGISIVDVRDERAAVHMAQAHAELTGQLGVALVTAGPGVTNAMTGIANAHVSRAPSPGDRRSQPAPTGKSRRPAGSGPYPGDRHDLARASDFIA
ncbi:thiamine pyrophosphate-binding protein [Rhodopila sp.]|uniref:thiamine pyrophosphate-binding protein n=1 Tax=Rhodopila sp. TaxID=2480087 RepID=UPI003D0D91E0